MRRVGGQEINERITAIDSEVSQYGYQRVGSAALELAEILGSKNSGEISSFERFALTTVINEIGNPKLLEARSFRSTVDDALARLKQVDQLFKTSDQPFMVFSESRLRCGTTNGKGVNASLKEITLHGGRIKYFPSLSTVDTNIQSFDQRGYPMRTMVSWLRVLSERGVPYYRFMEDPSNPLNDSILPGDHFTQTVFSLGEEQNQKLLETISKRLGEPVILHPERIIEYDVNTDLV